MSSARLDRHVHELDLVRILTFVCVIGVHTFSATNAATNPVSNGAEMLLHFTRESFFFLTGFVLLHQYGSRRYHLFRFWRRRLLLVGAPYLAWSLIYTLWRPVVQAQPWAGWPSRLAGNIMLGTAWYHLYFLLVSLQIYLLFPLLCWLVRATAGHHAPLLATSAALQLALLSWLAYGPPFVGWAAGLGRHQDVLVWNYQFWIVLGGVAAAHRERVTGWVLTHRPLLAGSVLAAAALALGWYCAALVHGTAPIPAAAVLQPVMVVWSLAAIAGLFAIGTSYAGHRRPGRLQAAVNYASDRSFGIFLVHPLVLSALLWVGGHWVQREVTNPALSLASYLVVVAGAVALTEVLRHSRLSLVLTGRNQLAHRPRPPRARRLEGGNVHRSRPPAPLTESEGITDARDDIAATRT